jgi:hypothetical protein
MPDSFLDLLNQWKDKLPKSQASRVLLCIGFVGVLGLILSITLVILSLSSGAPDLQVQDPVTEQLSSGLTSQDVLKAECCLVEVAGAVQRPGLYTLPAGSKLKDLIQKAEGFHPKADVEYVATKLNLAEDIQEGLKITVPFLSSYSNDGGVEKFQKSDKISVNFATEKELIVTSHW